ncbi:hypothetical protein FRC18_005466 [Serendipita sp. 400]|nr:hypothetical protein FRC18_005466 [Serendipita sp. 400]
MSFLTLHTHPWPISGALMSSLEPMSTHQLDESAVVAAANAAHAKLRLSRIGRALDSLNGSTTTTVSPNYQQRQGYLLALQQIQQQSLADARQHYISLSRKEATAPNGIPEWQAYMDRLVQYRQLGHAFAQSQADQWRDDVLESVEAGLGPHRMEDARLSASKPEPWVADPAEDPNATLSPACAEHLLLFEESQVTAMVDFDAPQSDTTNPAGYDTDPGTPYISEPGTETDSVSSGPMSPADDFSYHELPGSAKAPSPISLHNYIPYTPVHIFHRQFLAPADAPKSKPFSYEDIYTLYDIFDKTGIEYYIFERKRDSMHQMEVKSCQKVDLLRPFVEISRRFLRPNTHTQIPLEILLRMSRVIVNSFAWPQLGETWRQFLGARTERYRREKEELDARTPPGLRRAEHADFCYSFMITVSEYIGSNPALLDSVIDCTRLGENEKWDYVLAYRCIWENLGLIRYSPSPKPSMAPLISIPVSRHRSRPTVTNHDSFSRMTPPGVARSARRLFV